MREASSAPSPPLLMGCGVRWSNTRMRRWKHCGSSGPLKGHGGVPPRFVVHDSGAMCRLTRCSRPSKMHSTPSPRRTFEAGLHIVDIPYTDMKTALGGERTSIRVWCRHVWSAPSYGNQVRTRASLLTTPGIHRRKKSRKSALRITLSLDNRGPHTGFGSVAAPCLLYLYTR